MAAFLKRSDLVKGAIVDIAGAMLKSYLIAKNSFLKYDQLTKRHY
ncbi:MAG: hypothetical protein UX23_C0017G0001 [Parcubacteria group bacterium GW2011_GWB1_45_9]|nr:MAG: hypothetical protein UX23_C0017G0001 [Parcubacteria group bacterium GW2011_GWB1_45_9]